MDITDDMIELVLARVESMPEHLQLHLGGLGSLDKNDLIKHIKSQDEFGKKIVETQMDYLRAAIRGFQNA